MHRLNEIVEKLTPAQVKEVEDFAEFLIQRPSAKPLRSEYLNVNKLAGILEGLGGDKTGVELAHEATEIRAAKYMD